MKRRTKIIVLSVVILILLVGSIYYIVNGQTIDNRVYGNDLINETQENTQNVDENNISEQSEKDVLPTYKELSYGTSENGRDLEYYSIAPNDYDSTILMVFAIHGYEDMYDKDAKVLVDIANYLVQYYKDGTQEMLSNTRLLIVPCANPDGLYDGKSNNGFGRCNAKGIDLNRDFDALHKVFSSSRNYTKYPFSAKESKALRDLVYNEKPSIVIDLHGWENCTIGDGKIAKAFKDTLGLKHKTEFNNNCNGYFSYWAHLQGADSLLVEFKNTNISKSSLVEAVNKLLEM